MLEPVYIIKEKTSPRVKINARVDKLTFVTCCTLIGG